jgi:large subunit ribosomal protein L15
MQMHSLKRVHKNKKKAYVGRGGKRGKTSGKGTKGQNSRAGRKIRPEIRDLIKRLPKLRGRGQNLFRSIQIKPVAINLNVVEKAFSAGDTVSPQTLVQKNVLEMLKGNYPRVKILGTGDLTKKVTFSKVIVSESAKKKIEGSGSTIL